MSAKVVTDQAELSQTEARLNELIRGCADEQSVVYLDPGRARADTSSRISTLVLFDHLRPTMVGYAILGDASEETVGRMMAR
ncbi:hypothetical protein HNR00_004997 [Methylorubrum rhodinum]|uniref:Uncharacterized protein n=1 Tax=Methylorubrum rhodinum TaxID=29428 RepID=A0A840ZT62_9HYPH|nr:hypothetical protein [Methylorubrum rhodinum]